MDRGGIDFDRASQEAMTRRLAMPAADPLDHAILTPFHAFAIAMAAATAILDGFDNQMLGLAVPSLISGWGISKAAFGPVFALGFVGMGIGTLISGWIGDRNGRRTALIGGVLLFSLATLARGFADSLAAIGALRTLAGLGLGGVPGTASALIAEMAPQRQRSVAVTAAAVCVSIGGIFSALAAAFILPSLGWRWLFYLGGGISLFGTATLAAWLLESPRFLAGRPERSRELSDLLARMRLHGAWPTPPVRADGAGRTTVADLFHGTLARDTIALSIALLTGMFVIYLMASWAPTLLVAAGLSVKAASLGLSCFHVGGTIGAIGAAFAIGRTGSRMVLVPLACIGALIALGLAMLGLRDDVPVVAFGLLGAFGLTANAAQSAVFALGTHVFPTELRARGMGVMGGAGRVGALLSAAIGAVLVADGAFAFFGALLALLLVNAAALGTVRRHIPAFAR